MTAAACTQPGCGGTIEDGYCDVCGLAPAPAPPPRRRVRPIRPAAALSPVAGAIGTRSARLGPGAARRSGRVPPAPARHRAAPAGRGRAAAGRPGAAWAPGWWRSRRSRPRPGHRGAGQPAGAGEQALLRRLRAAGRARPGTASPG